MGYLDLGFKKFLQGMLCQFGKDFGILFNIHCLTSNVERLFPLMLYVSSLLLLWTMFHALVTGITWRNKV
jgi:hypothetical protein